MFSKLFLLYRGSESGPCQHDSMFRIRIPSGSLLFWPPGSGYAIVCTHRLNMELEQSLFGLLCRAESIAALPPFGHIEGHKRCFQISNIWDLLFMSYRLCAHWLRPRTSPLLPHLGSQTKALLVSQDRRHLFVTSCLYENYESRSFSSLQRLSGLRGKIKLCP